MPRYQRSAIPHQVQDAMSQIHVPPLIRLCSTESFDSSLVFVGLWSLVVKIGNEPISRIPENRRLIWLGAFAFSQELILLMLTIKESRFMFRIMVVFVLYKTYFVNFILARPLYHDTKRWNKTKTCSVHVNSSLLFLLLHWRDKGTILYEEEGKKGEREFQLFWSFLPVTCIMANHAWDM